MPLELQSERTQWELNFSAVPRTSKTEVKQTLSVLLFKNKQQNFELRPGQRKI